MESSPDLFNSMGSRLGVTRGGVESSKDPGRPRALRSGAWGVEDSRDRQQKAASGVGSVEDSGDRNNHHNIEFWGGSRAPHMLEGREGLRLLRAATLNIE